MSRTNIRLDSPPAQQEAAGPGKALAVLTTTTAIALVVFSLADQLWITLGWQTPWDDARAPAGAWQAANVLLGLTFTTLAVGLRACMPTLPGLGRVAKAAGWVLTGSFAVVGLGFCLVAILARPIEQLPWLAPLGLAFLLMFLAAIPFGLGLRKRTPHRTIGALYALAIPAILVTAAIGAATGTAFGHPAIGESFLYLATAALVIRSSR